MSPSGAIARLVVLVRPDVEAPRIAPRSGTFEEVEGDRGEEWRDAQVVVGQAGQDRQRVPALRPALAHPPAVAEAAVEKLEGLDVVARWRHVGIGADEHRRHLET